MLTLKGKINVKHATGELPEQELDIEYIVPETLEEAIKDAGGEPQLLDAYVDAKAGRAKQAGRNLYRNAPKGSAVAEIIEKVKAAVLDFSFANSSRGEGVKKKAEKVDNLISALESGREFTREELMAMLKSRG